MLRAPGPCIHGGRPRSAKDGLAPCPLPRSEGLTDLLGSFASRKIYLSIYNIYICVCLITTHPHAYTYCYSHSLTRAPAAAGLPRSPHLPREGKDGKDNPIPWGCAFVSSSPTPQNEGAAPTPCEKSSWKMGARHQHRPVPNTPKRNKLRDGKCTKPVGCPPPLHGSPRAGYRGGGRPQRGREGGWSRHSGGGW